MADIGSVDTKMADIGSEDTKMTDIGSEDTEMTDIGSEDTEMTDNLPIIIWLNAKSPHCRAVRMLVDLLEIEPVIIIELHYIPERFKEVSPQKILPTIQDGNFFLWQSRAIMVYLCSLSKAPIAKELYPEDPKIRAKVDQFLYFDACNINPTWGAYSKPILKHGKAGDANALKEYKDNLAILDRHLKERQFVASDNMTLADLSMGASISGCEAVDLDLSKEFLSLHDWLDRLKSLPVFKEKNEPGVKKLKAHPKTGSPLIRTQSEQ